MIPVSIGIVIMLIGFSLMLFHWTKWNWVHKTTDSAIELRYHLNQFRRRALIGSMMALIGSILASLSWIQDKYSFTIAIVLMLMLLACILILAMLDLLYVIVRLRVGPVSHAARAELIKEYHKRRQQRDSDQEPPPE